jgi:hypothetical protein
MKELKKQFFERLEQAHRQFHSLQVLMFASAVVHPVITAGVAIGDYAGHIAWAAIHPHAPGHENKPNDEAEVVRAGEEHSEQSAEKPIEEKQPEQRHSEQGRSEQNEQSRQRQLSQYM